MKFGVIVFPGINCDRDSYHVIEQVFHQPVQYVWHEDTDLSSFDCVILPGGFSYGDYLRAGAIARFSPVMRAVERFAAADGLVLGICNGFQILVEAGLLPGAMLRNDHLQFRCDWVRLRVESTDSPFTSACRPGQLLEMPIAHQEGSYYAPEDLLERLESRSQVLLRYCDAGGCVTRESNPNGSLRNIAGVCNEGRNVFGLMPHPERCSEAILGGTDGMAIFRSIIESVGADLCVRPALDARHAGEDAGAHTGAPLHPDPAAPVGADLRVRPDARPEAAPVGADLRVRPVPGDRHTAGDGDAHTGAPLRGALKEVALTEAEYEQIVEKLGRAPNMVELGMFGAMWSEHCGYKNSKPVLKLFPTKGPRVLQGPGENAGAVDIGDGLAVVMKIESHNHPSAVEPYQGAATGVGGIVRDIFTMGARPIALLDSLRFGPPTERRNRYLFSGVVGGVGGYGNCIGVPTVGGEIYFEDCYSGNPLLNAMCVGIARADRIVRAKASGAGNPVILVGADTGRDGIHGATFASVELNDRSEERRPAVQVGNPFLEKLLIEACLELLETDYVVGMQDLGAAGLTSSAVEMAGRGGCGIDIDLLEVSRREQGMTPYEVMLSESQERMLVVARRGCEGKVRELFARWGLHSDLIGTVTEDGLVRVREGERVVAEIPARLLTEEVPVYRRDGRRPAWQEETRRFDPTSLTIEDDYGPALLGLLGSPNLCSRRGVFRQYDHTVQVNTVVPPGEGDAAVLRIVGTDRALALTTDCNGRYCYLDPKAGGAIAVAEAARNLVCVGAEPLAITDCLNFGNPEKPEVYYCLRESVAGMSEACETLGIPVISGNVSLYNENNGTAIYPTPVVGMVGLLDSVGHATRMAFQEPGDLVVLLGRSRDDLGGTEYVKMATGKVQGVPPHLDLEEERRVQRCTLEAIRAGLLRSAHDCAEGGLAVALAECCIAGNVGLECSDRAMVHLLQRDGCRVDSLLFGESQSRIVVSLSTDRLPELERLAAESGVPMAVVGRVAAPPPLPMGEGRGEGRSPRGRFRLGRWIDLRLGIMHETWSGALERLMSERGV